MSAFWPAFSETAVAEFITGATPEPVAFEPINTAAAATAAGRIHDFLAASAKLPAADYACLPVYQAFESDRLAALSLVLEAGDPAAVAAANDRLFGTLEALRSAQAQEQLAAHLAGTEPKSEAAAAARGSMLTIFGYSNQAPPLGTELAAIENARTSLRPLAKAKFGFVDQLLAGLPNHRTIPSESVQAVLQQTITAILGPSADNWQARVKAGAPNIFVDLDRHAVVIPAGRRYTPDHVKALTVHEIGVHVLRASNGAASQERLAGYGLPGYAPVEEALAVLLGSAGLPKYEAVNSLAPLAIIDYASSPAQPSFRQVFDFAADLVTALANPSEAAYQAKSHRYRRAAFSRVIRVLRLGRAGLIERSTTKYWRGLMVAGRHFSEHPLTQASFDELFLGKYDFTNPSQLELIKEH